GEPDPDGELAQVEVRVLLKRAGTLSGRVTDRSDDHPLPGVHVHAEPMDPGAGRSEAETGADGRFTLEDIAPGNYALTATVAGYTRGQARSFDATPDAEIAFKLDRQGSLAGTVVGSDGRPVHAFDMQRSYRRRRLDPAVPVGSFQRIANADGSFFIKDLDPGFWSVDVWAKGYSLTSSEPVKVKQGEAATGLTVTLLRGSTLTGTVRDAEGRAVPGAEISLHDNREPEVDFLRDTTPIPGITQFVHTDAEGRFRLEDLSARKYQVQVDHPDFAILRRNDVAVAAERDAELEAFVLQRAAVVKGAAVTASGEPLAGVTVSLTALEGFSRQTTTDSHGQFLFTRVREGDYQLVCYGRQLTLGAMLSSVRNPPESFHVTAGATLQHNAQSLE
ncbi:MAG TPA: carboxypeptidase regulatory-like domain-containing protein, partial [Planctomycetota bacterium]|nr:carboxypeptidase regulatory-like domain-containing protein [Planctomycetota bacterium]